MNALDRRFKQDDDDMSDLTQLPDLGWFEPRRWLPAHLVGGLLGGASSALGIDLVFGGGKASAKTTSLTGTRTRAEQLIKRFEEARDRELIGRINRQLAGEKDFPIIAKGLGMAIGKLGVDYAAALYSTASAFLGAAEKSGHVFVRDRDELWRVEAIGKSSRSGTPQAVYVSTLLLVDPFRSIPARAAWILHEQRYNLLG